MLSEVWLNERSQAKTSAAFRIFRGLHGENSLKFLIVFFIRTEKLPKNRRNDPHCTLSGKTSFSLFRVLSLSVIVGSAAALREFWWC